MFTLLSWPTAIIISAIIWLILLFGQRRYLRRLRRLKIHSVDLMFPFFLWISESISFQSWRLDVLAPWLLVLVGWGIAMALWQGFVSKKFNYQRFFHIWWRLMSLASCLLVILLVIMAILKH